jgi:signal transduction histidine kinase
VRFTVQDSGIGIDPEDLDRLFDAFHTTKNDGMGMGLSVSRSIIEAHHGRLCAMSNDGPGATFFVSMPGARENRNLYSNQEPALNDKQSEMRDL